MMRDYAKELQDRVLWIQGILKESGAKGIIFGNSGGKDSALVGILCRKATDNVQGIMMPAGVARSYAQDTQDADALAQQFDIPNKTVDLASTKEAIVSALNAVLPVTPQALANIAPRLRMTTLYALGQSLGYLVAGTGNRSEAAMGYYTKWGDGAHDFNPIADLTVTEIYEFLRYLGAPASIIDKAPSAGLFEGQTDEQEMGITYAAIDEYLLHGRATPEVKARVDSATAAAAHKRSMPKKYE